MAAIHGPETHKEDLEKFWKDFERSIGMAAIRGPGTHIHTCTYMEDLEKFWKDFEQENQVEKLKEAIEMLAVFSDKVPGGISWWSDKDGNEHSADWGYICDYLEDLKQYLNRTYPQ